MALDVNDYDVPENVLNPEVHEYLVEKDKASELESLIKSQYINFDSLGNILKIHSLIYTISDKF